MIDIEVEAEAWTAALPEVEALVRAAAEAALQRPGAHHAFSPPALPGEGRGPRLGDGDAAGRHTSDLGSPADGHRPRPSPGRAEDYGEVVVLLTDDEALHGLNRDHRGQDKPTNVLSFPAAPSAAPHLGDVALAFETCAREASEQGKSLEQHLQHLVAHGVLHLLGWDHMTEAEAQAMEDRERAILAELGAPDPYRDRDLPEPPTDGRPRQ